MFNNKINGHKYIGKTKDLYNRYREHYYRKMITMIKSILKNNYIKHSINMVLRILIL